MGHLSNDVACCFIRDDLDTATSTLILGHLSEHNNHPAIIVRPVRRAGARRPRLCFTRLVDRRIPSRPTSKPCHLTEHMIPRYTRPEMGRIFSDENRFAQWLEVELAASEALAEVGRSPADAAKALRAHAGFDVARIHEIEREVKHDVIAFTTAVSEKMAAAGASRRLPLAALRTYLERRRRYRAGAGPAAGLGPVNKGRRRRLPYRSTAARIEFKHTVQIGRTHGIHAEPITFGLKLALWYDEMLRNISRLSSAAEDLRVGKISGAVGTFGHIGPEAEEKICQRLGLEAGRHRFAGDRAGPACGVGHCARDLIARRSRRSPSKSAIFSAPKSARPRSRSARAKKAPRRCRTSAIR